MGIRVENVNKKLFSKSKETHTLSDINLEFKKGEFICLLGPSGCEKSTLFNIEIGRPRQVDSIDLSYISSEVMQVLKEEIEKVARKEYDSDWDIEKDSVLYSSDTDMGVGL